MKLQGTEDDGHFKEEKEIDAILIIVLFLACAFAGYVLTHLL
ncbi:MAG: hypothetical protein ABSD73_08725 [Candidatus Bathyarchaeia archaeon]